MCRTAGVLCTQMVDILSEERGKKCEEAAGNFEPENTAGMSEGAEEGLSEVTGTPPDALAEISTLLRYLRGPLPHGFLHCRGNDLGTWTR